VWYARFNAHLLNIRCIRCSSDTNFILNALTYFFIIIGICVDNLVIVSNDLPYLKYSKTLLAQEFTVTKNGNIEYCLGIQIKCNEVHKIIFLSQEKYSYDILHKLHMETCKPIATPLQANIHYSKEMMPTAYEKQITITSIPYVNAIGSLMYLALHIRPDMTFPIIHLAQFFVQS
jgi:hypothetical protein